MPNRTLAVAILLICSISAGSDRHNDVNNGASRILGAAEGLTANLKGVDRAYAYWLISRIYQTLDPVEESKLLPQACQAAITAKPENSDTTFKEKIEYDCLRRMMVVQPESAATLLLQADANVRQQINAAKASSAAKSGNIDAALELLTSDLSQGAQYPYDRAIAVMASLPGDNRNGRDRIFAQALSVFRQRLVKRSGVGMEDLGTMVVRFHKDLSQGLVLEGVNELLDAAQDDDAGDTHLEISINSGSAAHSFGSSYQYRLFQLLPVLKELDSSRAEKLLRENQQIAELQKQNDGDSPLTFSLNRVKGPSPASAGATQFLAAMQLRRQADEILQSAKDDPSGSFTKAKAMPDNLERGQSLKADLLMQLARIAAKDHEALAMQALDEVSKMIEQYPVLARCKYLVAIGEQYSRLKKVNSIKEVVKQGMRAVKQLYDLDTSSDDPNQALKSSWPSTVVSRAFLALAAKVSPSFAEATVAELPDPDLQVFSLIQVADAMLAIPSYPNLIQQRHKQENANSTQVFDMPSTEK